MYSSTSAGRAYCGVVFAQCIEAVINWIAVFELAVMLQETAAKNAAVKEAQGSVAACQAELASLGADRNRLQDERKELWRTEAEVQTRVRELLNHKRHFEKQVGACIYAALTALLRLVPPAYIVCWKA